METSAAFHARRPFSAAVYLAAGIGNGWVLSAALLRLGIRPLPFLLGISSAAVLLTWIAVRHPRTAVGQICGKAVTYLYALQPILLYAAVPGIVLLLLFPGSAAGIVVLSLFLFAGTAAVTGCVRARRIAVTYCGISTKKTLPGGKIRIVHLSDLHLGFVNDQRMLKGMTRRIRLLRPDMICITGDTFENGVNAMGDPAAFASLLASLHPPLGTYACLGNHDAGRDFGEMLAFFRDADITLLRDETACPHPHIRVAGRRDATPGGRRNPRRKSVLKLLGGPAEAYTVLLDHQPRRPGEAKRAGADLLLCGHTHGGQFFPVGLFVSLRFPHMKGIRREGDFCTVISAGSGAGSPPIRLGSRGEIVVLDVLEKAKNFVRNPGTSSSDRRPKE